MSENVREGIIRQAFYEWVGALSIDEIMCNPELMIQVERLYKLFQRYA